MSGIKDKVVVITGASSGIGEATALLLAERDAKVVLGARSPDRLEALASRIAAAGGEAAYARTDVKRREDVSNLVGLAIERYGKLDVLVNNAGVAPISLLPAFNFSKENLPSCPVSCTLARARVSVADTRARMRRIETVTGEGGHFEFAGLPAGKYGLEGSRSGYITAGYEQHEQYSTAIVTGPEFATEKLVLRRIESHRDRVRGWRDAHKTSGPMMSLQGG